MEQIWHFGALVLAVLFNFGSNNSLPGLFVATCIVAVFTLARARKRSVRLSVMRRAILPKRIVVSASGRTDIAFTLAAFLIFGLLIGWAVL